MGVEFDASDVMGGKRMEAGETALKQGDVELVNTSKKERKLLQKLSIFKVLVATSDR